MVVRDFAMTETANFWQKGRLVQRGELRPQEIGTEMFFLPAALPGEKDGTVTNTSRLVQWHDMVLDAPGDSRSDLWFMYHLGKRLKELYADSKEPRDAAIQALTWDLSGTGATRRAGSPRRSCGRSTAIPWPTASRCASFQELKDDGSTACGGWMYCGIYPRDGHNMAALAQAGWALADPAATRAGRSPGRRTAAPSTIAHRRTRRENRGRNARR